MSKKIIWILVAIVLVLVVGIAAYLWGTKSGSQISAGQVGQAISDYLNKSEAKVAESCSAYKTSGDYRYLDVGGKYTGVWSGGRIVGVCRGAGK
jgi:flagellar basal body-associated protein FliL